MVGGFRFMSIAITDDHQALAGTVADLLERRGSRAAARDLLEADVESLPAFWTDMAELGWLGLAVPEEFGGSGFGLPELTVVIEELGHALAPGPFVPTVIASSVLASAAANGIREKLLPGLADGSLVGAVALGDSIEVRNGAAHGTAAVVSGGLADVLLVAAGADVAVVDCAGSGVIPSRYTPGDGP